jgi:hypothetical protein
MNECHSSILDYIHLYKIYVYMNVIQKWTNGFIHLDVIHLFMDEFIFLSLMYCIHLKGCEEYECIYHAKSIDK